MKILPVNTKQIVSNYPYGRLRTQMTFAVDFNPKKGFRHTRQTINPKNGRVNALKMDTYMNFAFLMLNPENNHVVESGFNIHSAKKATEFINWLGENAEKVELTEEQNTYICSMLADTYRLEMIFDKTLTDAVKQSYKELVLKLTSGRINFHLAHAI